MRITTFRQLTLAAAAAGLIAAGCSFTKFDDLEEEAPGHRVVQDSESDGFGRPLIGLTRPDEEPGGALFIAGTGGNPALFTGLFSATGGLSTAQSKRENFDEKLGLKGFGVQSMAAAPADKSLPNDNLPGPFAYVGATGSGSGRVVVVDINSYKPPLSGGVLIKNVTEFGASLARARFASSSDDDVVVGASGRIFFLQPGSPWPSFTAIPDQGYAPGANDTQVYKSIAAGDLNPNTAAHEVVAAAPDRNYVAVVHGIASCFGSRGKNNNGDGGVGDGGVDGSTPDAGVPADSGSGSPDSGSAGNCGQLKHFQIQLPADANSFGAALLIADVDEDGKAEVVIGAPDTKGGGAVYVYDFEQANFDSGTAPAPTRTIPAPEGVTGFGTSLAFGPFDGQAKPLLAVGAPTSENGGTANAGKIVLYSVDNLAKVVNTLRLASPESADLLGSALTVMPFRKGDEIKRVLAASVKKGVVVFFANTTENHKDFRK